MATTYTFKGTADMSNHDKAIQKSANEVKKYKEQCDGASQSASKIGKQDFSGAYRSQKKMQDGVKGFTNAMNGASKGITGMIGKAGIWGAAIAAAISVGTKAVKSFRNTMGKVNSELNDTFGRESAAMQASWDRFLNRLSNFDLSHLREEMATAAASAQTLYDQLDRKQTYSYTANTDIARINNDINDLRNQVTAQRNIIRERQRTEGANADVSAERAEIKRLEALIDKKITELGNIYTTQMSLSRNAASGVMKAAGLSNLSSRKANAMEGLTAGQRTEFEKIFQATMGGSVTDQFRFLTTDVEDQFLNELQRAIVSSITGTGINRAAHGYPTQPGDSTSTIAGEQILTNLGYRNQAMKNNRTQEDLDRNAAMNAFLELIKDLRSMISDDDGGVIDQANKHLQDAEAARASQISQRAQQLADENKNNKVTTSGPTYPEGSIGWYEKEIQKLQDQIKKSTSASAIEGFQASIEEYRRKISALEHGEGSIDYIKSEMTRVQKKISETSDKGVRQQLQEEYNTLESDLLNIQWPQESPQWIEGKIESLKRQMGEAMDAATRDSLQAQIDSYTQTLNATLYANNELGRVTADLKYYQELMTRTTGEAFDNAVNNVNRLNHELNDLKNKKGSIDWIQEEIRITSSELNSANTPEKIVELTEKLTKLHIELAKLENIGKVNIEIKSNIDLEEEKLQRWNDAMNSVGSAVSSVGDSFRSWAVLKQGKKDWDELTEAEQKEIEKLQHMGEAFDELSNVIDRVYEVFQIWKEAQLAAEKAASTISITAETAAIQQQNVALAENNVIRGTSNALVEAGTSGEIEEATARATSTAAITAEGAAAGATASTKAAEAVAGGTARAASLPFPYNLAAIAAVVAALAGVISLVASLNKYAEGGIVGGNSFAGDNMIARVNSGEMILNRRQQSNLFKLLNSGFWQGYNTGNLGGNGGSVHFRISGSDLVGVLGNHNRKLSRVN